MQWVTSDDMREMRWGSTILHIHLLSYARGRWGEVQLFFTYSCFPMHTWGANTTQGHILDNTGMSSLQVGVKRKLHTKHTRQEASHPELVPKPVLHWMEPAIEASQVILTMYTHNQRATFHNVWNGNQRRQFDPHLHFSFLLLSFGKPSAIVAKEIIMIGTHS